METLENETSVRVLVLNVTVGACPKGSKPVPRIVILVVALLTEALSITTVVAANADMLLTISNNITRPSEPHLWVIFASSASNYFQFSEFFNLLNRLQSP
jgi:hypothetical protein